MRGIGNGARTAVSRTMGQVELPDTAAGRRRFLEWTEGCIDEKDPDQAGDAMPDGQSLQSTFRRGWYFGSEKFREKLVELLGTMEDFSTERQKGFHGDQTRDRGVAEARRIVAIAEEELGLNPEDWAGLKKGDWRKGLVASLVRERALIDNGWLARRLHMGARNAVSRIIRHAKDLTKSDPKTKRIAARIRKNVSLI